jgi:hypothetical protein
VSVASSIFTAVIPLDNSAPVSFVAPVPSGITAATTYYVINASGSTCQIAAIAGGPPLTVANASGLQMILGARVAFAPSDVTTVAFGTPTGTTDAESFENVAGIFGTLTVDTSTSTIYAAGHTFVDGSQIQFVGPGLPTSTPIITEGTTYYATNVVAGVSFQVSVLPVLLAPVAISAIGNGVGEILITTASPTPFVTGTSVVVAGVTGVPAANGTWSIATLSSTQFLLLGSTFSGAWTGGGTVSNGPPMSIASAFGGAATVEGDPAYYWNEIAA